MNNKEDSEYSSRIAAEAQFWDERAAVLETCGRIPLWFDHRRGEDVTFLSHDQLKGAGIRANPVLYRLLFTEMIQEAIQIASRRGGSALDLGCGAGWLSLELARAGMIVEGIDISPGQIAVARRYAEESRHSADERLHGAFGSLTYRVADLNQLILTPETYDSVVCFGSLHHIESLEHLLDQVHCSMKPGASLVVYEYVGFRGLSRLFSLLLKMFSIIPRLKSLVDKTRRQTRISPFEDVSSVSVIEQINRRFVITERKDVFLFLPALVTNLRLYKLPDCLSVPMVKILRIIEEAFLRSRVFPGSFVFLTARNKDPEGSSRSEKAKNLTSG